MAALTASRADTLDVSDALAVVLGRTQSEAGVGITDSRALRRGPRVADTVGVSDSVALRRGPRVTDAVGVTDTVTPVKTSASSYTRTVADVADIGDALLVTLTGYTAEGGVGITDTRSAAKVSPNALADAVGITDTVTPVKSGAPSSITRTPADQLDLTDLLGVTLTAFASDAGVGITDTRNAVKTSPNTITRTIADTVGVFDSGTGTDVTDTLGDTVGVSDTATGNVPNVSRTSADSVGVTDTAGVRLARRVTPADSVGLADTVGAGMGRRVTLAEAVGAADTVGTSGSGRMTLADVAGLSDALGVRRRVALGDAEGVTDTAAAYTPNAATVADGVGVSDAVGVARRVALADGVGLADTVGAGMGRRVTLADVQTLGDTLGAAGSSPTMADTVGVTDTLAVRRHVALTDWQTLGDTRTVRNYWSLPGRARPVRVRAGTATRKGARYGRN